MTSSRLFKKIKLLAVEKCFTHGLIFCGFYVFYGFLFLPRIHGFGNYWDAVFPYFKDQIPNFFNSQSWSWVATVDSPLKYSADYFFRFLVSRVTFLEPEYLLYSLTVSLFAFGSFGIYLIENSKHKYFQSLLISFAVFISPALFYKLNAGHTDYLISFSIFIFLLLYLIEYFTPTKKSYIILGLLLAFVGVEIQFFIISFLVVLIYFFVWKEKFNKIFFPLLVFIPVAINLPWFLNSIDGAVSLTSLSVNAAAQSFPATLYTSFLSIFDFSFSQATQLNRYYPSFDFVFFAGMFFLLLINGISSKFSNRKEFFILNLILFIFLGTGLFQNFNLGPLNTFFPMFRESGHFAPLVTLFLFIFWAESDNGKFFSRFLNLLLVIFILLNTYQFFNFTNEINFNVVRNEFFEFESFIQNNVNVSQRVITYPFFDQYGFTNSVSVIDQTGYRLNNAGHDSFIMFSGVKYIDNIVPAYQFHLSLQYQLLTNRSIDFFDPFSISYLFNFSNIYESHFEKYTSPSTYFNDLSLIKNNSNFVSNILKNNPNSLIEISPDIYKVSNPRPYISSFDVLALMSLESDAYSIYKIFPNLSKSFYYTRVPYYDNLSQTILSNVTNFKMLSEGLGNPMSVDYVSVNPTRDVIYIKSATKPFFLALSENFGSKWKLEYGNIESEKFFQKHSPFARVPQVSDTSHYELNDALNGWYVDPQQICISDKKVCTANPDGSYDMQMSIEFWPQRWMDFGFVVSSFTLATCMGYVLYNTLENKYRLTIQKKKNF